MQFEAMPRASSILLPFFAEILFFRLIQELCFSFVDIVIQLTKTNQKKKRTMRGPMRGRGRGRGMGPGMWGPPRGGCFDFLFCYPISIIISLLCYPSSIGFLHSGPPRRECFDFSLLLRNLNLFLFSVIVTQLVFVSFAFPISVYFRRFPFRSDAPWDSSETFCPSHSL